MDINRDTEGSDDQQPHGAIVVAQLVPLGLRQRALHTAFGRHCVLVERAVYGMLRRLCPEYDGGYWHFYNLSNGGFYLAPDRAGTLCLSCEGNGYERSMSADAAGIVASLMALSHLSFEAEDDNIATSFHLLREFAANHPERRAIWGAID